jgi:hypothetical protein
VTAEDGAAQAIDLGAACNNRCAVCPRAGDAGDLVGLEELTARIDGSAAPLRLHGGEPTLRSDLDTLIERAARAGRQVVLETNGRAFAVAGRAAAARRAGLERASVALLGSTARSHDGLARAPGAFRQALAGAQRLRAAGVALTVRLIVTRSTLPELPAMATLALGLGASEVRFSFARADDERATGRYWLLARYALASAPLAAATAALRRAGRAVSIDGAPRCLVPDGAELVATAPACFAPAASADAFSPRCAPCTERARCPGVPPGYLARFGDGELAPR